MGNLSAIHHERFNALYELTGNYNKSTLLDKLIYWWQISTFTLDDDRIWFTRSIEQISEQSKISRRSVERYLHEFERAGLIERVNRLMRVKHLYIRITEKLLALVNQESTLTDNTIQKTKSKSNIATTHDCLISNRNGAIDCAEMACSIYEVKVKNNNEVINTTVSEDCSVNNFQNIDNTKQANIVTPSSERFPIEPMIGERITKRLKNYIKGMLKNVQGQYNLKFSDPDRLFAEVIFSVTQEQQWQGITNPHHRVNIIAKLLKQKQWKTPKGFYNHWDVGLYFRKKDSKRMETEQQKKLDESCKASAFFGNNMASENNMHNRFEERRNDEYRFSPVEKTEINTEQKKIENEIRDLSTHICSEESYLKQLEQWLEQKIPSVSRSLIDSVAMKIAGLYAKKEELLEKIAGQGMEAA